jgi:hypothetical protein
MLCALCFNQSNSFYSFLLFADAIHSAPITSWLFKLTLSVSEGATSKNFRLSFEKKVSERINVFTENSKAARSEKVQHQLYQRNPARTTVGKKKLRQIARHVE